MKKALVSGGAGFIGSHLCTRLINEGNRVICLDNFFTGSKDNIKHLIGHPCFELVEHDVVNPYCADVDEIYNLACPASPIHYQYDAIKTAKTAVFGTFNMLGLAKKNNARMLAQFENLGELVKSLIFPVGVDTFPTELSGRLRHVFSPAGAGPEVLLCRGRCS